MSIPLAQLIREARLRQGIRSQGELARAIGCSPENINAIENGRNKQPSPKLIDSMARILGLAIEDIYSAIAGRLHHLPWERVGEKLDLRDPELELMFRELDDMPNGEVKERVKAFIRFTFEEERRKKRGKVR